MPYIFVFCPSNQLAICVQAQPSADPPLGATLEQVLQEHARCKDELVNMEGELNSLRQQLAQSAAQCVPVAQVG